MIVAILAVIAGGGILWRVTKQKVPFAELPEVKKPEKIEVTKELANKIIDKIVLDTKKYDRERAEFFINDLNNDKTSEIIVCLATPAFLSWEAGEIEAYVIVITSTDKNGNYKTMGDFIFNEKGDTPFLGRPCVAGVYDREIYGYGRDIYGDKNFEEDFKDLPSLKTDSYLFNKEINDCETWLGISFLENSGQYKLCKTHVSSIFQCYSGEDVAAECETPKTQEIEKIGLNKKISAERTLYTKYSEEKIEAWYDVYDSKSNIIYCTALIAFSNNQEECLNSFEKILKTFKFEGN